MRHKMMNLQMFTAGENQGEDIRTYTRQLSGILSGVFKKKSYWSDFFTPLQTLDGISHKDVAFTIKTNDVAAAVSAGSLESGGTPAYNTGANVAFGSGTGSTNRFGNRTEVKYTDEDVEYTWDWVYHEGIDKHTVNEDFDAAHAREMEKIANGITGKFNAKQGEYLSANAGKTVTLSLASADTITSAQAIAIFNEIDAYMTDIEVDETLTRVAAVTPALYNAIVDNNLSTTSKGSDVNIDRNEVRMFKDFVIRKLPSGAFQATEASSIFQAGRRQAMARTGIRFEGIKDLEDKLRRTASMDEVKTIVRKNGDELNLNMKRNAGSGGAFTRGYSTGETKRSINTVITDGGLTAEVEPGTDYSQYVEYGTRFMDAEPFVRPAFEIQAQKFKAELESLCR